ncbi:MAG: methyltransferase [Clostridia bacterium]|nr:methyltransferase [Clostridia bacterium]
MQTRPEDLGGNVSATVSALHTFGTDALALAHFASPRRSTVACDLGSGCGIIPLLFCRDGLCRSITAVDVQAQACAQIRDAVERNGLAEKLHVVQADLRALTNEQIPFYSFDLVTMNPPYVAPNAGLQSTQDGARIARHEILCTLQDVTACAEKLLRFGGRLCICNRPDRLADAMCSMRACGIEPKRLRLMIHSVGKKPSLFLLEGKKGANSSMVIEPPLYLKDNDGRWTADALSMYGLYQNERTTS